ncbi:MAG: glycoside hydrolase family 127 protein [Kiritimatiellaeota bacterium]|nr:glycoside hydrolase family 127 protein [Kiritimatiellota bacterium]
MNSSGIWPLLVCSILMAAFRAGAVVLAGEAAAVTVIERTDPAAGIIHYAANRPPLTPSSFVELPFDAVKPGGWLKQQLELQAEGFHGRLTEISGFLRKPNNAWLSKDGIGDHGWEEPPYWLKGFIGCAYLLDNPRMIAEVNVWIEGALASQQPDGWFGPDKGRTGVATDLKGRDDLWPNMIMLFCLQTYYGRTGDQRVLDLMTKYFKYLAEVPEPKLLVGYWPSMRGGDQLYSILWLYNRTGGDWLLDLARKTHRRTARWDKDVINWHNVNIPQGVREPATFWQLSQEAADLAASGRDWTKVRTMYGQVPGGMYGADENARPGYTGPRQAVETCGMAEEMLSDEILAAITGDPAWAERCENVAFNSYPAAMTADLKALRYLTAPNQPQSDHTSKAPGVQNGGDTHHFNPHSHRCCQHNSGHAWPYFTAHLWYAAPGNGLAALLYAPCQVRAKVGAGGAEVRIVETTRYPFEDRIEFALALKAPVIFPLVLRIPAWCAGAKVAINGAEDPTPLPAGRLAQLNREWKDGDKVLLTLPMTVRVKVWTENRGFASVDRGPLTYSLRTKEEYKRQGGTDAWPAFDVFPGSPWNYGLVLGKDNPAAGIRFEAGTWPADNQPFRAEAAPVRLTAHAKRIPGWTLDSKGLVQEVVQSPVRSTEPEETVTLIPMGAARLRITAFPVIGDGPDAKNWP